MEHSEWPGPGHTPSMGQEAGPGLPEMHRLLWNKMLALRRE